MTKHVVSTLSSDTRYAVWATEHGMHRVERHVLVKGGARVAAIRRGDPVTLDGVVTHVSDEEARMLAENSHFKRHQERGFVKILNTARDPEAVAQSMSRDEGSRPRTPEDVKASQKNTDGDPNAPRLQAVTNHKK